MELMRREESRGLKMGVIWLHFRPPSCGGPLRFDHESVDEHVRYDPLA
jgi:hypothetical protein